jgi:hypothetical protein
LKGGDHPCRELAAVERFKLTIDREYIVAVGIIISVRYSMNGRARRRALLLLDMINGSLPYIATYRFPCSSTVKL